MYGSGSNSTGRMVDGLCVASGNLIRKSTIFDFNTYDSCVTLTIIYEFTKPKYDCM